MLSGNARSLYVTAEPTGLLFFEPTVVKGETTWRLSLLDEGRRHLLHLQSPPDHREAWDGLVRELVLYPSSLGNG